MSVFFFDKESRGEGAGARVSVFFYKKFTAKKILKTNWVGGGWGEGGG